MTTYFTAVSNDLLAELQSGERMPATLRLKRVVGPIVSPHPMSLVEFEDDDAEAVFYAGRTVTPVLRAHYDGEGRWTHSTIVSRDLDKTIYQVAS